MSEKPDRTNHIDPMEPIVESTPPLKPVRKPASEDTAPVRVQPSAALPTRSRDA
ncbi:hypothetical protein [Calditerricola satsumensis]|uniref:Uncharacterized protein n=1 Tax=Calditerricola satsumensis TaxID=373054 RepID=A0A8J3F9D2_9BACI|nr:hypothetical protein [Calditerricola satsumensis]GGJ96644.1 hypothetical protein GCM10007043_08060 [Calditerricola satsumensis]